jgi:hypothetical protein
MARKRVLVLSSNGPVEHITHPEAFSLVQKQQAEWVQKYSIISLIDKRVAPRGVNRTHFDDVWKINHSAGVPVWQVRRGALAGN